MPLFSKEQSYLGVDIGKGSIKIVELLNDRGRARLVTYGFVNQGAGEVIERDFIDQPVETGEIIKKICKKAKTRSTKAIAALPVFSVFSSVLNLTNITAKEKLNKKALASRVEWEAKKIIPLPLEEMILDWKIINGEELEKKKNIFDKGKELKRPAKNNLDENNKGEEVSVAKENGGNGEEEIIKEQLGGIQILLTAAPKKLVKKYIEIFKAAGLELLSLETEAFAIIRSLLGSDKSPVILLDSGAARTNLSIVEKGIPYLNRSIDIGGAIISKGLGNRLGIEVEKAEQFKIDLAGGVADARVYGVISSALKPIINEIKYSLNIYRGQEGRSAGDIEKLVLAGGSSLLADFADYLKEELKMRVYLGDPWSRVIYPEDLKPLLDEIGPRFAVAIGLAMRDID